MLLCIFDISKPRVVNQRYTGYWAPRPRRCEQNCQKAQTSYYNMRRFSENFKLNRYIDRKQLFSNQIIKQHG